MTPGEAQLHIGRDGNDFARGAAELSNLLIAAGVDERPRFNAELVFEELVTNVIRYGDADGDPLVEITVRVTPEHVVLVICDRGSPFDPLARPDPKLPGSLAEATVGGLGIMLARKAASSLDYARVDGRNQLQAVISLH